MEPKSQRRTTPVRSAPYNGHGTKRPNRTLNGNIK